ncbi:MAG: acyl-CoA dehydrogenase family protein [Gammaproteobacteria bacterium]|nr:acyl-CoA dehydrogenase family protein [Gammaproteobacteria bacterium]MBQ0841170.1 acyl-CoA dehydrogenase family protein [Gammaproteobacteria bacterium]
MSDLEQFREQTRAWLEANCPASQREPVMEFDDKCWGGTKWRFSNEDQRTWLDVMAERGWTAPDWPAEYGGGGLSKEESKILREEMYRIDARPPLFSMGLSMIGPALLQYGSEELKRQHIPNIVKGKIWWCQGYSEPSYGSDLAGLQTRCVDKGDYFEVNGQKVWTSYAERADWMFCLVRTDPDAVKHAGISLVLFDMTTPGVRTSPIKLISGNSPFCETFLDNVRVEKDQLVGTINQGWELASYLLTHERAMIGNMGQTTANEKTLHQHAIDVSGLENGQLGDSALRTDIAQWEIDILAFELTQERIDDETKAGTGTGATSSMLKYAGTELNKQRYELLTDIHGQAGLGWEGDIFDNGLLASQWLRTKGNSIEGGTSEIQLNIISKRILGLGQKG